MSGELFPRERQRIAPGAVHLPDWLGPERQRALLAACRDWAKPPAGLRTVHTRNGVMSVRQVCLGWHWGPVDRCPNCGGAAWQAPRSCDWHGYPYGYTRTVVDGDGAPVKPFPGWLGAWAREAVAAAGGAAVGASGAAADPYDVALVNVYGPGARMGMHRDSDERSPEPVVSFSLGDACVFRLGTATSRGRPWHEIELRGGDAFVFGGPARLAYHGVPRTRPGSGSAWLGLDGRVNVTVRATGCADPRPSESI